MQACMQGAKASHCTQPCAQQRCCSSCGLVLATSIVLADFGVQGMACSFTVIEQAMSPLSELLQ